MSPPSLAGRRPNLRFPLKAPTWPGSLPRPAPERRIGLDYDHEWSRRYPVRLARAMVLDNVTRPVAKVMAPTTVRGLEYLRHLEAPAIFVANHASHVDTPLLLTTLPVELRHRTVVAAAADYFFDRRWKSVLWSFSLAAIPIDRSRVNRRSADTAAQLLEDGWNLVIFPEGGRSPDGWAQAFKGGAAYLAKRTGRPVVPVYLHGSRHVLAKKPDHDRPGEPPGGSGSEGRRGGLRRSPVTVLFGPPLSPAQGEDARRLAGRIETAVGLLAAETSADWWTARRRHAAEEARPTEHALHGPDTSAWRRAWALGPRPTMEPAGRSGAGSERPWPKL